MSRVVSGSNIRNRAKSVKCDTVTKRGKLLELDKESLFELLKKAIIPKEDTY